MGKSVVAINAATTTQYFYPADDNWETQMFYRAASIAGVDVGTMMAYDVSGSSPTGYVIIAPTTNANGKNFVGILQQDIKTTDDDYATAHFVPVRVPKNKNAKMYFTLGSGTFTQADVGRMCALYSDSKSVAVDTNGIGVTITDYIDATHGLCKLAPDTVTS